MGSKIEANELVIATLFSFVHCNANSKIPVVPFIAGINRSFSISLAPTIRGDAMCAMCVTSERADEKAAGAPRSRIIMISSFPDYTEGPNAFSTLEKANWERTLARTVGLDG